MIWSAAIYHRFLLPRSGFPLRRGKCKAAPRQDKAVINYRTPKLAHVAYN